MVSKPIVEEEDDDDLELIGFLFFWLFLKQKNQ